MRRRYILTLLLLFAGGPSAWATPILLSDVPNYFQSTTYSTGCAPNSAATILGYWDLHGYDRLFDATGWEEVRYTSVVENHISSEKHRLYKPQDSGDYEALDPPTALTDYMKTSTGGLEKGWTLIDDIGPGISQFTWDRGYTGTSAFIVSYITASWDNYVYEITQGNPVLLMVDSDSNGEVDHAVAGIGFEEYYLTGRTELSYRYYFYESFSEDETRNNLGYYDFLPMENNRAFGLYHQMITVHAPGWGIEPTPAPEPMTLVLFALGISTLVGSRHLKKTRC